MNLTNCLSIFYIYIYSANLTNYSLITMIAASKHQRLKSFMERKYKRLVEEAYNYEYTDHSLSDVCTFEALKLDQKLKFLKY